MATPMVLTASHLNVTGPGDLHTYMSKIELSAEVETKDVTTFASLGWREVRGGIKQGTISATFLNDITDDQLDEDMWAIFGTVVAFVVRASQSAVGASNPNYTGSVLIDDWTPLAGSVGDVNEASVQWPTSGAITRAIA